MTDAELQAHYDEWLERHGITHEQAIGLVQDPFPPEEWGLTGEDAEIIQIDQGTRA